MAQTIVLRNNPAYKEGSLLGYDLNSQSRFNPVPITLSRDSEAYVEKNGVLTRVNPDVPRIDSDGALLVEPQRTNFILRSQEIDNATWGSSGVTKTANTSTSPDGTTNADTINGDGTSVRPRVFQSVTLTATAHRFSVFAKAGTNNFLHLEFNSFSGGTGTSQSFFDLNNGTTPTSGASIIDYGNGWYRCISPSYTPDSGDLTGNMIISESFSDSVLSFPTAADSNGQSVILYGAQVEAGSYATSYIKTEGATATRSADVVSQTGLANLLGDAEGALFVEASIFDASSNNRISINGGSANNSVFIASTSSGQAQFASFLGGLTEVNISGGTITANTFFKIAGRYALNNFSLYLNGSNIGSDSSANTYSDGTLTDIKLNQGDGGNPFYGKIKALAVYDTALDNSELANITTNGI